MRRYRTVWHRVGIAGLACACALRMVSAADAPALSADAPNQVIAVMPLDVVFIDGAKIDAGLPAARAMEDLIQVPLSDAQSVTLVDRASIEQVLKEQSLALSGLVDPATAARVGQLLKAEVVVVGRIRPLDGPKRLATIRAVSVADARVMWCGEAQGDDAALAGQAASLGAELVGALHHLHPSTLTNAPIPLGAAKHHERALALNALGAHEEAATEELLALRVDPSQADADLGFLKALAAAGFERLAAAQAAAELAGRAETPADAPLRAMSIRTGMPTAAHHEEAADNSEVKTLKRFVDIMVRRVKESAPDQLSANQQDEIRARILLGDAYVAQQQDRKARAVYHQALLRLWALRAHDELTAYQSNFAFPNICDTAAARAIEMVSTRINDQNNDPVYDPLFLPTLREALSKKQGLPDGAQPPLIMYFLNLPLLDRVLIPERERWDFLFKLDLHVLPADAVIAEAHISGLDHAANDSEFYPVPFRWVGAEATSVFARTGVAWPAHPPFGNDAVLGRLVFVSDGGPPLRLRGCILESQRRGPDDHGIVLAGAMARRPDKMPDVHVGIFVSVPSGKSAGMIPSIHSRVVFGVLHLLAGETAAARKEFSAVETDGQLSPSSYFSETIRALKALCGDAP